MGVFRPKIEIGDGDNNQAGYYMILILLDSILSNHFVMVDDYFR